MAYKTIAKLSSLVLRFLNKCILLGAQPRNQKETETAGSHHVPSLALCCAAAHYGLAVLLVLVLLAPSPALSLLLLRSTSGRRTTTLSNHNNNTPMK